MLAVKTISPNNNSVIFSIDRVKDEMKTGDKLGTWIKDSAPDTLFVDTNDNAILQQFAAIMQWVQSSNQYLAEAKAEFAQIADGWLVACAKVYNYTVVTHEVHNSLIRKKVPIPNICKEFNVSYVDTFLMLRDLHVRLNWQPAEPV